MPFVTHFKDTDGQQLPIAASTLVTVEIPAAGSADKGGWHQAAESTTSHYNQQAGHNAPKNSAVIPHCTDPSVFTNNGLRVEYEEQLQGWVLWIDSLPETACTLTLLFINHSTEGTPCVLPALGVRGSGGGGGLPVVELTTVINTEGVSFSEAENAMLDAIGDSLFILKGAVYVPLFEQQLMFECIPYKMTSDGSTYVFENFFGTVLMMNNEGQWIAQFMEKENVEIPV